MRRSFILAVTASVTTPLGVGWRMYTVSPTLRHRIAVRPSVTWLTMRLELGTGRLTIVRELMVVRR